MHVGSQWVPRTSNLVIRSQWGAMSKAIQLKKAAENSIKVAVQVQKGIAVHAKGDVATIVAVGAAAGIACICVSKDADA